MSVEQISALFTGAAELSERTYGKPPEEDDDDPDLPDDVPDDDQAFLFDVMRMPCPIMPPNQP